MDYERIELTQPVYGRLNVYRVGDTLIDTGHPAPVCRDELEAELDAALAGVERVVLTHPHVDHVGGSLTISRLNELPHTVYDGVPPIVGDFGSYLEAARDEMAEFTAGLEADDDEMLDVYFPVDDYPTPNIERVVGDGDNVRIGDSDFEVVHTPGHSAQHMALRHGGTVFSGDLVSQNGHFMYAPIHTDVGDYVRSLERVLDIDPDVLLPGHGEPVEDPRARIRESLEKAERTEGAVLGFVEEEASAKASRIADEALNATEETRRFLTLVTCSYLEHLADTGKLRVEKTDDGVVASV